MKTALVCIAKNEDNYIDEWIDYHLKLGFDDIFIYENDWEWKPAVENPNVHLIPWPGKIQQLPAYNNFIDEHFTDFNFAAFLDVDEFLATTYSSIKEYLMNCTEYPSIAVNWRFFGDNNVEFSENNYSVIKRFTKAEKKLNKHVKIIINFDKAKNLLKFYNPHAVKPIGNTISSDLKRTVDIFDEEGTNETIQINHYLKTREEYVKRAQLGTPDIKLTKDQVKNRIKNFDEQNPKSNEVDDFRALDFYTRINSQDKMLDWFNTSNSTIKRLYYRPANSLPLSFKSDPAYPADPRKLKIGVVLSTCGSIPFVDLGIHFLKKVNGIENILIHDDHSDEAIQLKELAQKNGAYFFSTVNKLPYMKNVTTLGDTSAFYEGLKWAKSLDLDILVKFSRRFIPCFNWSNSLRKLVVESDGVTFSSKCIKDRFSFRTEGLAMNVDAWSSNEVLANMAFYLNSSMPMHAEYWFGELAKMIDWQNFSNKYFNYRMSHYKCFDESGYVNWRDVLGINRYSQDGRAGTVLWHMYSTPEDYWKIAESVFPGKYKVEDFN